MKVSKFSEQQIALILKQVDDGLGVEEVCRKAGVSQQTYYRWRKKYGGLMPSEVRRLKQLEEEKGRLKWMVADLSLDKQCCRTCFQKSCEACEGTRLGRPAARHLPGFNPACLRRSEVSEVELLLQSSPAFTGCAAQAHPGDRGHARALRLPEDSCPAAPRGLASKRQARLSPLRRGKHANPQQTTQAQGCCQASRRPSTALRPERRMGNGLSVRPVV